ncbi:MAG: alpha-glycosidase [Lachnospiraceae bacterium]|nr:alpha-glycosidase [Lachnospiraceae bacterium]
MDAKNINLEQLNKVESNQRYIAGMTPILKKEALFSDTSENYVIPAEPSAYDPVTIKFRAGKNNIDRVFLVTEGQKHLMVKNYSDENFDYYLTTLQLENERLIYYFEVISGRITCIYDIRGFAREADEAHRFTIIPGFRTPDWAKGAVMYQILVDRFYNGDTSNDVLTGEYSYINEQTRKVEDWNRYPAQMDVREFYGGDLQGVLDKMDYLEDLGIEVIYFNPLFVSPSNHKYDIQDYDYIDPHIGKIVKDEGELLPEGEVDNTKASRYITRVTDPVNLEASNELFAKVVKEAHKRGIRVILDGVFNHCGSFNKWLDREKIYNKQNGYKPGAFVDYESPYHDFFQWHDGNQGRWPYNTTYDGWWGHDTLPKLNFEASRKLQEYILYIGKKWVSPPFNADGWRLDVAADLGHSPEFNHYFWQEFRRAVKQANPDAIVLAEHYGSPKEWLFNREWDTVMNYDAFMEPVSWFLTGMQKHSDDYRADLLGNAAAFFAAMRMHGADMPAPSLFTAMNELSNHDHSRFLTRTNRKVGRANSLGSEAANEGINKAVMREAVVLQLTWPGAPTIYYGDEAGVCGFTDPDNRRSYPWGQEDQELIKFHKEMIRIHKENKCLKRGSMMELIAEYNVIGYGRFQPEDQVVVLLNNGEEEITRDIAVWRIGVPKEGVMQRLMLSTEQGFTTEKKEYPIIGGKVTITLPKTSAIVLQYSKTKKKNFLHFM